MGAFRFQILGAGRGGTSLLGGLVDAHPACDVHFETFAIEALMGRNYATPRMPLAQRTAARIERFRALCEAAAAATSKPLFGHKTTTEQVLGLGDPPAADADSFDPVAAYVAAFRDLLTIFIVRDGRSCIPSKMRRVGMPLDRAIARWKFSVDLLRRLRDQDATLHVLKMEDLITDGPRELAGVCGALGIGYDPAMLTGTRSRKMLPEYRRDSLDGAPVAVAADPEWVGEIAAELDYLGYRA